MWARPSKWGSKYRDPFPAVEKYQLRYCDTIAINAPIGAAASYLFRANSIYDPDQTGTGHQPYGHDQLNEIYNHYCVDSSTITVTPTTFSGVMGISVTDNQVVSSGFNTVKEQQATSISVVPHGTAGTNPVTLKKTYNRWSSFPVYKDTSALMGANPAEEAYFQLWVTGTDAGIDPANATFLVTITYNVTCYELKDLGSS
uniref:hypothetical protein n=1 Tax=Algoriphagus sp. TaxID=1872435 RepID=UPI004048E6F8